MFWFKQFLQIFFALACVIEIKELNSTFLFTDRKKLILDTVSTPKNTSGLDVSV